jgi:hypothetical protein
MERNHWHIWAFILLVFLMQSCEQAKTTEVQEIKSDTITAKKEIVKPFDTLAFRAGADTIWRQLHYLDSNWVKMTPVIPGALLPFHRIVAFYGNLNSTRMGILGELPRQQMITKLMEEVKIWQQADSSVKVIPALHLIAVVAQRAPGADKKYRGRMSDQMIKRVISWADSIGAQVFLDIQVGHSTLQEEIPQLDTFLSLPNVHLGIDAEFAMRGSHVPGTVMGQFEASDVNFAVDHLKKIVKQHHLPPKILIVHRFKEMMIQDAHLIHNPPEVQVVMDMDGWGSKELKFSTWKRYIEKYPVQYTGFKLFYKNDTKSGKPLMTPAEVLSRNPKPLYIQYQ